MKITGTVSVFVDDVDLEQVGVTNPNSKIILNDEYKAVTAANQNEHFLRFMRLCESTGHDLEFVRCIGRIMPRGKEVVFRIMQQKITPTGSCV